jgi:mycothiol synthase
MRLRPARPEDDMAVMAVIRARDIADFGVPDYTLEDLHDQWRASDMDLGRDAVIAEDADGGVLAYASVHGPGASVVIDPGHEGQGIGTRILRWVEQREHEQGRPVHRQWAARANASGREFLLAAGYSYQRTYSRMMRTLGDDELAAPELPGVELRALDPGADGQALHALDAAAFSANADYREESLTEFTEEHLAAHDLDPQLSLVAIREGALAGFLLARRWNEQATGFIDILAVHPDHQHHGLGRHLLRTAFSRFHAADLREAQLGVASDNPRALALYEQVGMTVKFQIDVYERPVKRPD